MDPYIGQIILFAGNYTPQGWVPCDGRLLPIVDNEVLFQLIGTTYGGDGMRTFAVPDLRGRAPVGPATNAPLGMPTGVETVSVGLENLPAHTHTVAAKLKVSSNNADQKDPTGKYWAVTTASDLEYTNTPDGIYMAGDAVTITLGNNAGTAQETNNMQPYQCVNFIMALLGGFPQP